MHQPQTDLEETHTFTAAPSTSYCTIFTALVTNTVLLDWPVCAHLKYRRVIIDFCSSSKDVCSLLLAGHLGGCFTNGHQIRNGNVLLYQSYVRLNLESLCCLKCRLSWILFYELTLYCLCETESTTYLPIQ